MFQINQYRHPYTTSSITFSLPSSFALSIRSTLASSPALSLPNPCQFQGVSIQERPTNLNERQSFSAIILLSFEMHIDNFTYPLSHISIRLYAIFYELSFVMHQCKSRRGTKQRWPYEPIRIQWSQLK